MVLFLYIILWLFKYKYCITFFDYFVMSESVDVIPIVQRSWSPQHSWYWTKKGKQLFDIPPDSSLFIPHIDLVFEWILLSNHSCIHILVSYFSLLKKLKRFDAVSVICLNYLQLFVCTFCSTFLCCTFLSKFIYRFSFICVKALSDIILLTVFPFNILFLTLWHSYFNSYLCAFRSFLLTFLQAVMLKVSYISPL